MDVFTKYLTLKFKDNTFLNIQRKRGESAFRWAYRKI